MATTTPPILPQRILIIGGGLAGMAAAVALESAGMNVTLLESRQSLGGRAGSFEEPQTHEELDNCQHVLLGCCTNLIDFYRRIGALSPLSPAIGRGGVSPPSSPSPGTPGEGRGEGPGSPDLIRFERTIHFRDAAGKRFDLWGIPGAPAPLHLAPSLLQFSALTWRERIALSRAMLAIMRLSSTQRDALLDVPFGQWLDEHHQPASLIQKFYDPVVISGLNEDTRQASAFYAIKIFQDSLLANNGGYVLGLPNCPLSQLYQKLPCRDLRLGTRVTELSFDGPAITGVKLHTGEMLTADSYILATNYHAAARWIPPELAGRDERFKNLDQLTSVPILGAHLWFDRPILKDSHAALMAGPIQWLFRKDPQGSAVHAVISSAREWVNRPREECLKFFEAHIRTVLPEAQSAKLLRSLIVIEKRATFSPLPGTDAFRPHQFPPKDGIQNLYLAGDYTQTRWPSTMEGAVRSGYLAAEAILKQSKTFLVPDLPLQWPARWLRAKNRISRRITAD